MCPRLRVACKRDTARTCAGDAPCTFLRFLAPTATKRSLSDIAKGVGQCRALRCAGPRVVRGVVPVLAVRVAAAAAGSPPPQPLCLPDAFSPIFFSPGTGWMHDAVLLPLMNL